MGFMAQVFPFRAYRYSPERIDEIGDVLTQPYDKISPAMLKDYLGRHPCNIARVIKNRNHQDAGQHLKQWMQEGVLKQDDVSCFYPYEQEFEFEGQSFSRMGLIGLVSLEGGAVSVKGHERVLDEHLEDRLNLLRSTESNKGLIFLLYRDSSTVVDQVLTEFKQRHTPIAQIVDNNQVSHRLWQLVETDLQEIITETLDSPRLYIADGHHRFQSSLLYFQECREKGWKTAARESFDKRMVALFNMESPAVKILPTHRGIRNLTDFDLSRFLSRLDPSFEVQKVVDLPELELTLQENGAQIGLVAEKNPTYYVLRLREEMKSDSTFMPGITGPARELDVNVLHEGILGPNLGIGAQELASEKHVDYFRDRGELISRLGEGHYQLAFILNPTSLQQVHEISEQGEKMPQKSTDFYPKLLTGLTFMKMEIEKAGGRR